MSVNFRETAALLLVLVIFLGIAWLVSLIPVTPAQPQAGTVQGYTSETYGYSFTYPAPLEVREYTPETVAIGLPNEEGGFTSVVEVSVVTSTPEEVFQSFEAFAFERAKNWCAADGPDRSISCNGVLGTQPITTSTGMSGTELALRLVNTTLSTGETQTGVFGPVYAFPLPSEAAYAAVLIYQPLPMEVDGGTPELVNVITDSLQIVPR